MNGELNQSEDGSEIDKKLRENNSRVCSNQNESHSLFENDLETRNFERESFNIRYGYIHENISKTLTWFIQWLINCFVDGLIEGLEMHLLSNDWMIAWFIYESVDHWSEDWSVIDC